MSRYTSIIGSMLVAIFMVGCGLSATPQPTTTSTTKPTATNTPEPVPTMTNTNTPTKIPSYININPDGTIRLNGTLLSNDPLIEDVSEALGAYTRVIKNKYGAVYIYDNLGITFRTEPKDNVVTHITFYFIDETITYEFAPKSIFNKEMSIYDTVLPYQTKISEVMKRFPSLKVIDGSSGLLYKMLLGKNSVQLLISTDLETTSIIEEIALILDEKYY